MPLFSHIYEYYSLQILTVVTVVVSVKLIGKRRLFQRGQITYFRLILGTFQKTEFMRKKKYGIQIAQEKRGEYSEALDAPIFLHIIRRNREKGKK